MLTALRHLLSLLLLPFLVVVVVPYWLRTAWVASDSRWSNDSLLVWLGRSAGAVLILAGFGLFTWCVGLFAQVGQGPLAPWDPPRHLVVRGPYRFVRNSMISGVALLLLGQALLWGSWVVGAWACVFVGINHVYLVLIEEPRLNMRFGAPYRVYKANVSRWVPRLRPWSGR